MPYRMAHSRGRIPPASGAPGAHVPPAIPRREEQLCRPESRRSAARTSPAGPTVEVGRRGHSGRGCWARRHLGATARGCRRGARQGVAFGREVLGEVFGCKFTMNLGNQNAATERHPAARTPGVPNFMLWGGKLHRRGWKTSRRGVANFTGGRKNFTGRGGKLHGSPWGQNFTASGVGWGA